MLRPKRTLDFEQRPTLTTTDWRRWICSFYETVMVNGPAWKEPIQEEFGDGIMSAIDFDIRFSREADLHGDRVAITMQASSCPTSIAATSKASRITASRRIEPVRD